jgi:hypothetical protein
MSDEHLHDWLDNRPPPDRPTLAEAEADERQGGPEPCPACRGTGGGQYNDCPYCDGNGCV